MTGTEPHGDEMYIPHYHSRLGLMGQKPANRSFLCSGHTAQGTWALSLDSDLCLLWGFPKGSPCLLWAFSDSMLKWLAVLNRLSRICFGIVQGWRGAWRGCSSKVWKGMHCTEGLFLSGWSRFMKSNLRDSKKTHSSPKISSLQVLEMSAFTSIATCPSQLSTTSCEGAAY